MHKHLLKIPIMRNNYLYNSLSSLTFHIINYSKCLLFFKYKWCTQS